MSATIRKANEGPQKSWSTKRLSNYAKKTLHEANVLQRKSTRLIFRAGQALNWIHAPLKEERRWGEWLREADIGGMRAWRAMKLAERAGSEDEIADLTPTDAYLKYGIVRYADNTRLEECPATAETDTERATPQAEPDIEHTDAIAHGLEDTEHADHAASGEHGPDGGADAPHKAADILRMPAPSRSSRVEVEDEQSEVAVAPLAAQVVSIRDKLSELIDMLVLDTSNNEAVAPILEEISEMAQKGLDVIAAKPEMV
jgi:hypothetical protein